MSQIKETNKTVLVKDHSTVVIEDGKLRSIQLVNFVPSKQVNNIDEARELLAKLRDQLEGWEALLCRTVSVLEANSVPDDFALEDAHAIAF